MDKKQEQPVTVPGQILGVAVKDERIKIENEKDEINRYREILGDRKKQKTTASKDQPTATTSTEPVMYTHAHGHVCNRPDCTPIIVSRQGVIKPSRPSTGHSHISNIQCNKMVESARKV